MSHQYPWRRNLKKQPCVYCGKPLSGSPDHVPPRNLFVKGRNDLIRVPACLECNGSASGADESFRLLVGLAASSATPELMEGTKRSLERKPLVRADLRARTVYLPELDRYKVPLPDSAFEPVIERMTRALYWHEFGDRLDRDLPIKTYFLSTLAGLETYLAGMKKTKIGDGQVLYAFTRFRERLTCSMWVFVFHRAVLAAATTDSIWWDEQLHMQKVSGK